MLAGAPALVMATNRLARCTLTHSEQAAHSNQTEEWRFTASGFDANSAHTVKQLANPEALEPNDPARLCAWVIAQLPAAATAKLPGGVQVHTDTRDMYFHGVKLGLGSSAALTTALMGAIWQLAERSAPAFSEVHRAHQASQGGVGSGLDVATSLAGGVIRFQTPNSAPVAWPKALKCRFVYAGRPASTPALVGRFNAWQEAQGDFDGPATKRPKIDALTALINASATLANGAINLDNFARYIIALRALDEAATIGIYSAEHADIATAAEQNKVLYKPCGAGGGDLGVALSDSEDHLDQFVAEIGNSYAVINLEIASNGLSIG